MKLNEKTIIRTVLYASLGLFAFVVFSYFSFPYERVARVYFSRLEARTPLLFEFERVSPTILPGITLKGLQVAVRAEKESAGSEGAPQMVNIPLIRFDRLRLRLFVLSLLRGGIGLGVSSKLASGEAEFDFFRGRKDFSLEGKWAGIQVEGFSYLKSRFDLNLTGAFSGEVKLQGDPLNLAKGQGTVHFKVAGGGLRNATLMKLVTLPDMTFDRFEGKLVLKDGRFVLDNVRIEGNDLQGEFTGSIMPRKPISTSLLSINVKLRPAAAIDSKVGFLFGTLGMRKDPQGYYLRTISGVLARPR